MRRSLEAFLWCLLFSAPVFNGVRASDFGDVRNRDDAHTKTHFRAPVYDSLAGWEQRRGELKRQILISAGLWPFPQKTPLAPRRFGRREYGRYAIEKVKIETFPGFYLAGNLYLPVHQTGRAPGILVAHGHWKNGRVHHAEDYSVPALCINLAAQGYVVFAYDMLGYNDTQQLRHDFGDTADEKLWSFGPLGIQLWNSVRALDFLQQLPEVDPHCLAMTGASGGGTQTFLAASIDERIRAVAPVNMVSGIFQGDDACEMAPGLRILTNNIEITALVAPRPLLLVSSTQDWTRNTPSEEFPEIRKIYELYGQPDNVANRHINAPHNYNRASREAVYEFFNRVLMPEERRLQDAPTETEIFPGDTDELLINDESAAKTLPRQRELFEAWRASVRPDTAALTPDEGRQLLRAVMQVTWPGRVNKSFDDEVLVLQRAGTGERVPARNVSGAAESGPIVVVHSRGSRAALNWNEAKEYREDGFSLVLLDVYQTGAAIAERPAIRGDHLVFHPSDDSLRVQDILTGLASIEMPPQKPISLLCDKPARLWCWAAAAAADRPVRILGPAADLTDAEKDLPARLFIPGIQRIGGLDLIKRLVFESSESARSTGE